MSMVHQCRTAVQFMCGLRSCPTRSRAQVETSAELAARQPRREEQAAGHETLERGAALLRPVH